MIQLSRINSPYHLMLQCGIGLQFLPLCNHILLQNLDLKSILPIWYYHDIMQLKYENWNRLGYITRWNIGIYVISDLHFHISLDQNWNENLQLILPTLMSINFSTTAKEIFGSDMTQSASSLESMLTGPYCLQRALFPSRPPRLMFSLRMWRTFKERKL